MFAYVRASLMLILMLMGFAFVYIGLNICAHTCLFFNASMHARVQLRKEKRVGLNPSREV